MRLTRGQLETLLASPLSDLHFGMVLASALGGVRAGELHGLSFSDDANEDGVRRLHVLQQFTKDGEDDSAIELFRLTWTMAVPSAMAVNGTDVVS